jgi:cytochrome P450
MMAALAPPFMLTDFAMQAGESRPGVWSETPLWQCERSGVWVVESHALVKEVLADPAQYSSKTTLSLLQPDFPAAEVEAIYRNGGVLWTRTLQTNDPPAHRRFRALVERVFTASRVEAMVPGIEAIVAGLLDTWAEGEVVDVSETLSVPLPLRVIAAQLAVAEGELEALKRWSDSAISAIGLGATREEHLVAAQCGVEFQQFMLERLRAPAELPAGTLVALVAAAGVEEGFTEAEQLSLLHQLMIAGHETTTSTLSSALYCLATEPTLLERVYAEPTGVRRLVEDTLRLHAPVQGLFRVTTGAVSLGGYELPSRAVLALRLASANRDPARFGDNQLLSPMTSSAAHLSFGLGLHHCIGATLARRELQVALSAVVARFARLELAVSPGSLEYTRSLMTRSLLGLPLSGTYRAP